ncbi:MAG: hypothetical protein IKJ82_02800 [Oscillospiraceae bacterium]|nr:hypothetical protein [Oscillospiraceae bacterium]MBR3952530.1 hypothetical protein [Oscillospiraceae bacterium]
MVEGFNKVESYYDLQRRSAYWNETGLQSPSHFLTKMPAPFTQRGLTLRETVLRADDIRPYSWQGSFFTAQKPSRNHHKDYAGCIGFSRENMPFLRISDGFGTVVDALITSTKKFMHFLHNITIRYIIVL